MERIKALFKKLIARHGYSRCYTNNEYTGKAVFLMCECDDTNCPFNVKNMTDVVKGD